MRCPAQSHNSIDDNEFVVYSLVRPESRQRRTNVRPTAGRWVSGDDFFDREGELRVLESHVRGRNHLLLTGQRRMGKTSIARELGRRLEGNGWIFLFADVEGSTCADFRLGCFGTGGRHAFGITMCRSKVGVPTPQPWTDDR